MMSKQDFIALADALRDLKPNFGENLPGTEIDSAYRQWRKTIMVLASFCEAQNSRFKRQRWLDYIDGTCGANGGNCTEDAAPRKRRRVM